jgi:hypothetical protein
MRIRKSGDVSESSKNSILASVHWIFCELTRSYLQKALVNRWHNSVTAIMTGFRNLLKCAMDKGAKHIFARWRWIWRLSTKKTWSPNLFINNVNFLKTRKSSPTRTLTESDKVTTKDSPHVRYRFHHSNTGRPPMQRIPSAEKRKSCRWKGDDWKHHVELI